MCTYTFTYIILTEICQEPIPPNYDYPILFLQVTPNTSTVLGVRMKKISRYLFIITSKVCL